MQCWIIVRIWWWLSIPETVSIWSASTIKNSGTGNCRSSFYTFLLSSFLYIYISSSIFSVNKFVDSTHSVHFSNHLCSQVIHISQYPPIRSQFYHLFPEMHRAIIPTRWGKEICPTRKYNLNSIRRYCHEKEFHEAAPRQCDAGVRQQSDSLWSLLINLQRPQAGHKIDRKPTRFRR